MKEFQEKRRNRRKLYSKTSIVILAIIVVLLARGTWNIFLKQRESVANATATRNELRELQARHDLLETQTAHLQTPEGQEEAIREKYQVAKEGEHVIIMVESTSTASTTQPNTSGNGFWASFIDLFKKK